MRISDWSSDVCSSDLLDRLGRAHHLAVGIVDLGVLGDAVEVHFRRDLGAHVAGSERAAEQLLDRPHHAGLVVDPHLLGAGGGLRSSEEHTSELQSLMRISYAVFCLTKKQIDNSII